MSRVDKSGQVWARVGAFSTLQNHESKTIMA